MRASNPHALALAVAIKQGVDSAYAAARTRIAPTEARPDFSTPPWSREQTTLLVIKLMRAHVMPLAKRVAELGRQIAELKSKSEEA